MTSTNEAGFSELPPKALHMNIILVARSKTLSSQNLE